MEVLFPDNALRLQNQTKNIHFKRITDNMEKNIILSQSKTDNVKSPSNLIETVCKPFEKLRQYANRLRNSVNTTPMYLRRK